MKIGWREGKVLRNEEGKALGSGFPFAYKQRNVSRRDPYCLNRNFDIDVVSVAME